MKTLEQSVFSKRAYFDAQGNMWTYDEVFDGDEEVVITDSNGNVTFYYIPTQDEEAIGGGEYELFDGGTSPSEFEKMKQFFFSDIL